MQKSVFCTVLSSKRLIQGIACFLSLCKVQNESELYILCADDECYDFVSKYQLDKVKAVRVEELNRTDIIEIKDKRRLNQFCWTLKPSFIKYVINLADDIERVTYIDSDLLFLQNPNIIFANQPEPSILLSSGKIFLPMYPIEFANYVQEKTGNYNSGFISFKKDNNGIRCIEWWEKMCIESCTSNPEDNKFGDQKYLDAVPALFENVEVITTPAMNIGHWNYPRYNFSVVNNTIMANGDKLIFYHFSGFRVLSKYQIIQIHEQDRINQPFIYDMYKQILRDIIDEVERIDPNFKSYITTNEINDN